MQNHHIFAVLILVLLFPAGESCHHEISLPNCQMEKCLEICQTQCGPNEVGNVNGVCSPTPTRDLCICWA
ncbi:hypothetical protein ACOSP7_001709 [Xanthoceras sorbifolium]